MEYIPVTEAPIDGVIEALRTGQIYTKDLSPDQRNELYSTIEQEVTGSFRGELAGPATQAYLLSMVGAVKMGVNKMGRFASFEDQIVAHDDCVQQFFSEVSMDWHIGLQYKDREAATLIMHRARSTAQRLIRRHDSPGFVLPFLINSQKLVYEYQHLTDVVAPNKLQKSDYDAILVNAQAATYYLDKSDTEKVVKDFVRAKQLGELLVERITDEDEWETRCAVESDTNDDEWVGVSNEPSVTYDYEETVHWQVAAKNLPWQRLSPKQKDIIEKYFGLTGEPPMTLRQIADFYGQSYQNMSLIVLRSLDLLGDAKKENEPDILHTADVECAKNAHQPIAILQPKPVFETAEEFIRSYKYITDKDFITQTLALVPFEEWKMARFARMHNQGLYPGIQEIQRRFGGINVFRRVTLELIQRPKEIVPDPWVKI